MASEQKVAIITGASRGIGACLLRGFRKRGYAVIANSRSMREIEACVYRKPHPSVMPRWNRLSWRDDRAVQLCTGRPGLAIQVEVTA